MIRVFLLATVVWFAAVLFTGMVLVPPLPPSSRALSLPRASAQRSPGEQAPARRAG